MPLVLSIDVTPAAGWSVTKFTPVLKKVKPADTDGLVPSFANAAIASMPFDAINNGYCCEVAPITPDLTEATPGQPPSTETIKADFPAFFNAW